MNRETRRNIRAYNTKVERRGTETARGESEAYDYHKIIEKVILF